MGALFDLHKEQATNEGILDRWSTTYQEYEDDYEYNEEYEDDLSDAVLDVIISVYDHHANGQPLPPRVYCSTEVIDLWKMFVLDFENNREFLDNRLSSYG